MHSFLIVSKDRNKASAYISNFLKEEKIDPLDIDNQVYEKAIGIEDVRNIQKKILLKPFRGNKKAIIIDIFEGISIEAQNALLKSLEEPPASTTIVISAPGKELILPTIISRCKVIELGEKNFEISEGSISVYINFTDVLFNGKAGDKLKLAQDIASQDSLTWLEKMSIFARSKLLENPADFKYFSLLQALSQTHAIVKSTNVNPRVALENLFLTF